MNGLTDNMIAWIDAHRNDDVSRLRLRYHNSGDRDIAFAILQIECRRKTHKKLYSTLSNPRFIFPTLLSSEQCTSDDLAKFHASLIDNGEHVLDMTCGLGIDSFHIARKAATVTSIEINPDVADAAILNSRTLSLDNVTVINGNSIDYINNSNKHYDTIFIDPARRGSHGERLYALSDCEPDVTAIIGKLASKCDRFIIKASPMLDITKSISEIRHVTDIYSIGTRQECKELVIVADFTHPTDISPTRHAVTISESRIISLDYSDDDELNATPSYTSPIEGHYLYEPFPAVMKSAPFRLLSEKYGIGKLHPNTHLYTSPEYIPDFPGDIFLIDCIIPFSSKDIKHIAREYPHINVAARNFILSADELRKRLKVKDGGEKKLLGTTATSNNRLLLILSPVHEILNSTHIP